MMQGISTHTRARKHTHTRTHTENTDKSKTNSWELAFVLCKVSMAMNTEHKVLAYIAPTRPP